MHPSDGHAARVRDPRVRHADSPERGAPDSPGSHPGGVAAQVARRIAGFGLELLVETPRRDSERESPVRRAPPTPPSAAAAGRHAVPAQAARAGGAAGPAAAAWSCSRPTTWASTASRTRPASRSRPTRGSRRATTRRAPACPRSRTTPASRSTRSAAARASSPAATPARTPPTPTTTRSCSASSPACRPSGVARATCACSRSRCPGEAGPRGGLRILTRRGTCRGRIATGLRGDGGFGYDPLFEPARGAAGRPDARPVVRRGEARDLAPVAGGGADGAGPAELSSRRRRIQLTCTG